MTINITNGDCLELMKNLPDKSVDLFICDLPYGETNCKWDSVIDLEEFWNEFKRLRKSKRTACIHFCSTKFGYTLIKSNEKMFKMDMVWKKRNKTGGLQSRHRPMRNHEMVYFFYEQAPKYNRDKYHKRIQAKNPIVKEEKPKKNKTIKAKDRKAMGESSGIYAKENQTVSSFEPPNPASVLEEKYSKEHLDNNRGGAGTNEQSGIFSKENIKKYNKENGVGFEPPNPASVLEEKDDKWREEDIYGENKKDQKIRRKEMYKRNGGNVNSFEPPNPASVLEEKETPKQLRDKIFSTRAKEGKDIFGNNDNRVKPFNYDPPNPASVLEETEDVWGQSKFSCGGDCGRLNEDGSYKLGYEPPNPASVYESTKVFIGKRHHQTEKPQDILEFFIKYWSDEGHTILDPTMGSGSTGVACKTLKRNFIGYEKDEKIFKVAENRIKKVEVII